MPLNKPPIKGRGTASNPVGRFEATAVEAFDDGWWRDEEFAAKPETTVVEEQARSIVNRNDSPDLPFDLSINPYRGCEHGCIYCYARPNHEYLNHSAGLDFETRLYAKVNAVELLHAELARPSYRVSPINIGAATDPYQPIERGYQITRGVLQLLLQSRHPLSIVTKNALVVRDLDLLRELAALDLVQVFVSVTTLDNHLASRLDPRASAPHARLRAVATLAAAGIPTGVFVAPVIPAVTDAEMEKIMAAARDAGAQSISYTLLRLPHGVAALFEQWLQQHYPDRATHVMNLIRQMRGGQANDPRFGTRMRGQGPYAELLRQRFEVARRKLGFPSREQRRELCSDLFVAPAAKGKAGPQGDLFA